MKAILSYIIGLLLPAIPPTRGFALKRVLFRLAGCQIAAGVRICSSAKVRLQGPLKIGCNTWVGHEVLFVGGKAELSIGANCDIAPRVLFATGSHELCLGAERAAGAGISHPISIGDGCWIGAGSIILGGSIIGSGSMVAAGAVVRGSFPAASLIGGVPARMLRGAGNQPA